MTQRAMVSGADVAGRTMHDAADDLADLSDAGAAAAAVLTAAAQGYAPRRTGRLRASIQPTSTRDTAIVTAGVGIVSPYPSIQEYGSRRRHITGSHYLRQAAEAKQSAVVEAYEHAVDKAIDQVRGA